MATTSIVYDPSMTLAEWAMLIHFLIYAVGEDAVLSTDIINVSLVLQDIEWLNK